MKDVLLDAAVAVAKARDLGATDEQVLEMADYIQSRPVAKETAYFVPTHMPNLESR